MVPFSINASTSLFFIFRQKSFLLSFIWSLYCCFSPSKWDQNGLILGTKKFGEHSPNSVVLLHFATGTVYRCLHLLHGKKIAETCSRLGRTVSDALLCHTAPETLHLCCCFVQQSEPVMLAPSATAADFPECSFADRISLCLRRCEMWPDSRQRMRRNPPICC